jgi:hypothetical protein
MRRRCAALGGMQANRLVPPAELLTTDKGSCTARDHAACTTTPFGAHPGEGPGSTFLGHSEQVQLQTALTFADLSSALRDE